DQDRVEEITLIGDAPRRGLVDRRHRAHRVAEARNGQAQVAEPITEIRTEGQHCSAHVADSGLWERRMVTETSAKVSGIGADGLWMVTSVACTRSSAMIISAMRPATVSMRSTGGPAMIAAAFSASSP